MIGSLKRIGSAAKGFIFTTDAIIVLPLTILIITAFMAFSVTLQQGTFFHEYAYTLARDQIAYLSDLPYENSGMPYMVVIINASINGQDSIAFSLANSSINVPETAGYVLERFDTLNNEWVTIAEKKVDRYKFNAGAVRLVTVMSDPYIEIGGKRLNFGSNTDYLADYDCGNEMVCKSPAVSFYTHGEMFGPVLVRLRVQI